MTKAEIVAAFESLARSQGSYGRLLDWIQSNPHEGRMFLNHLAHQDFKDVVDLIMYIEG